MRILIIGLVVFLAACGSSADNDSAYATTAQLPPNESTQIAALQAQVEALSKKLGSLTLIGKTHGVASDLRMQGEFRTEAVNQASFGPCSDMGVLIGFTNGNNQPADALSAMAQDFKQCTGYLYSVLLNGGTITVAQRLFWDGPNCTGNPIEWEASGAGYNTSALQGGVVFASPIDGSILMVTAGQTPQPIQIQSAWVTSNPGCQSDIETQLMYTVSPNSVSVSGVPNAGVGKFQLGSP